MLARAYEGAAPRRADSDEADDGAARVVAVRAQRAAEGGGGAVRA